MRLLASGLATFLLAVGSAAAKGPPLDTVQLCGRSACVDPPSGIDTNAFFASGVNPAAPAAPQPYYEVWPVYAGGGRRLSGFFVPGASVLYQGDWNVLDGDSLSPLRDLAARIEPWPAPTVVAATTGGRPVQNPASYIRLFTAGRLTSRWSGFGGWLRVSVLFDRSNPWAMTSLRISRKRGFVWRDGWIYRIPNALAARARLGLSLSG